METNKLIAILCAMILFVGIAWAGNRPTKGRWWNEMYYMRQAFQDLQDQIDTLTQRVEALEGELDKRIYPGDWSIKVESVPAGSSSYMGSPIPHPSDLPEPRDDTEVE